MFFLIFFRTSGFAVRILLFWSKMLDGDGFEGFNAQNHLVNKLSLRTFVRQQFAAEDAWYFSYGCSSMKRGFQWEYDSSLPKRVNVVA